MQPLEAERLQKFISEHVDHGYQNRASFVLIRNDGSAIGVGYKVVCLGCGHAEDITDYDSW